MHTFDSKLKRSSATVSRLPKRALYSAENIKNSQQPVIQSILRSPTIQPKLMSNEYLQRVPETGKQELTIEKTKRLQLEDGRIIVKKGDWLSKYSAAMFDGDTSRVGEFVRLKKKYVGLVDIKDLNELKEEIILIENKDLILEDEDIYHITTLLKYIKGKKSADKTPKPLILLPENIPVEKYKGAGEGLRPSEPGPFIKPKESEKPYKSPSILHGQQQPESEGERYTRELEEEERKTGGSPDLPGTTKGEVDLLKIEEYIKKYSPF